MKRLSHKTNLNSFMAYMEVMKTLTNHSSEMITKLMKNKFVSKTRLITISVLIYIWLLSATVMTQSYGSVMLNTYFHIKTTPVLNSLHDLLHNKHILIATITEVIDAMQYA